MFETTHQTNGAAPHIPDQPTMTPDIQLQIVDRQIALWQQEQYGTEISIRVHRRIGGDGEKEMVKNLTRRMEECEKALDELKAIRAELLDRLADLPDQRGAA